MTFMMKGKRNAIFITTVILITAVFWGVFAIENLAGVSERKEIVLNIENDMNNGTFYARINYNLDFSKKISHHEEIQTSGNIIDCPFWIEFFFYNNATFWINSWQTEYLFLDTGTEPINESGVNFINDGNYFEITWYKNIIIKNRFRFKLYISNALSHPNREIHSLSLESYITTYNATNLNNTFSGYQSVWLNNYQEKGMKISDANIDLYRYNDNQKIGSVFYHQNEYTFTDEIILLTKLDIDFSIMQSRINALVADIFFDLGITFPITSVVSYLVLDKVISKLSKQEKEIEKKIDKTIKQNSELIKELEEIKQLLKK